MKEESLNGFILLNKPLGITSSTACIKVKNILNAKKVGHAGTLDLNVSGVLIIALNNSTKLMPFFDKLDKEYIGKAKLHTNTSEEKLGNLIKKFIGKIKQLPPRKSHVARKERIREIYEFKILKFDEQNKTFEFFVQCEAGTYIRKLIHDLGEEIGGAQMIELKRTKQGKFLLNECTKLEDLTKDKIIKEKDILKKVR